MLEQLVFSSQVVLDHIVRQITLRHLASQANRQQL